MRGRYDDERVRYMVLTWIICGGIMLATILIARMTGM